MIRRDVDVSIAAVNPVSEASIPSSTLAEVELKIRGGIARERAGASAGGEKKRDRRRGPGFAIIAFAVLALAGTALAATGVWNPLASHHPSAGPPARSGTVPGSQSPGAGGAPGSTRHPGGDRHDRGGGGHRGSGLVPSFVSPPALSGEPEAGQPPESSNSGEPEPPAPSQPHAGGGGGAVNPGGPAGGAGGRQPEAPVEEAPVREPPAPQSTTTAVNCEVISEVISETAIRCSVRVTGVTSFPIGDVSFGVVEGSGATGRFLPATCTLNEGFGLINLCQVEFAPVRPVGLAVAHYLGNAAFTPSDSGPFEV